MALYAAYFFAIRQAAFQLALMGAAYLFVLLDRVPVSGRRSVRWITLLGVVLPVAGRCCAWCAGA